MVKKYLYGTPFETDAIVKDVEASTGTPSYGTITTNAGFSWTYTMDDADIVYGLGEAVRGINKRGYLYNNFCSDNPRHYEDARSLYAAHNFLIISGKETFGIFIDYPTTLTFDIGYTHHQKLVVTAEKANLKFYVIEGENAPDIVKQFRKMIGRSYIPPKFAFGYGQSRWGYKLRKDFLEAAQEHRKAHIPLDMVYLDIDYMQDYKDFTVNETEFPDFPEFVQSLKDDNIRLIPIIDAGVKIEKGYSVYDEGVEKGYFCKKADGSEFVAAVWPGWTHFPDVLNPDARKWFGDCYKVLTDQGIEGFWNDMNEPAIFCTPEGLEKTKQGLKEYLASKENNESFVAETSFNDLSNNREDYRRFYHNVNGQLVCHEDVHNLFGYNMTRAAGEAFERMSPDKRILIFSRSSYIGMHRYGGIWQGDNLSWWSHLLLNLKMMPSLNMVGILYTGADIGGFGSDTTRDLLLRWLALGVFTPLMRNHSAIETRRQEFYQFEGVEDFRHVIGVRYRILPYIYSEFMKAALRDEMMFRPLAFVYPDDELAVETEDQMMVGDEIMIAPVYTQNATGRYVYLPEEMMQVCFAADGSISTRILGQGIHFVKMALNEVVFFVRKGKAIPVADFAECVAEVDYSTIQMIGYPDAAYELYDDDGYSRDYENPANIRIVKA